MKQLDVDHAYGAQKYSPLLIRKVSTGILVAYVSAAGIVVLKAKTPKTLHLAKSYLLSGHSERIIALELSALDENELISAGKDGTRIWNISERTCIGILKNSDVDDAHTECLSFWPSRSHSYVNELDHNPQNVYLLAGCHDGYVRIYSVQNKYQHLYTVSTHQTPVLSIAPLSSTGLLATSGTDGSVRVWDMDLSKQNNSDETKESTSEDNDTPLYDDSLVSLKTSFPDAHRGDVTDLLWIPTKSNVARLRSRVLVTCGRDNVIMVWDIATGQKLGELGLSSTDQFQMQGTPITRHNGGVRKLFLAQENTDNMSDKQICNVEILSCGLDGTVRGWNLVVTLAVDPTDDETLLPEGLTDSNSMSSDIFADPIADSLTQTVLESIFEQPTEAKSDVAAVNSTSHLVAAVEAIIQKGKSINDTDKNSLNLEDTKKPPPVSYISSSVFSTPVNEDGIASIAFIPVFTPNNENSMNDTSILVGCAHCDAIVSFHELSFAMNGNKISINNLHQVFESPPTFASGPHTSEITGLTVVPSNIARPTTVVNELGQDTNHSQHRMIITCSDDGRIGTLFPETDNVTFARLAYELPSAIQFVDAYLPNKAKRETQQLANVQDVSVLAACRNGTVQQLMFNSNTDGPWPTDVSSETDSAVATASNVLMNFEKPVRPKYVWKPVHRYDGHISSLTSIAIEPEIGWLATAGRDFSLNLHDLAVDNTDTLSSNQTEKLPLTTPRIRLFNLHDGYISALEFCYPENVSHSGMPYLMSGGTDHKLTLWKICLQQEEAPLVPVWVSGPNILTGMVTQIECCWSKDETFTCLSTSWTGQMHVWYPSINAISPNSQKVDKNQALNMIDIRITDDHTQIASYSARLVGLAISPDSTLIATATSTGVVTLYNNNGPFEKIAEKNVLTKRIFDTTLQSICWSDNDTLLVGTSYGDILRVELIQAEDTNDTSDSSSESEKVQNVSPTDSEAPVVRNATIPFESLITYTGVPGLQLKDARSSQGTPIEYLPAGRSNQADNPVDSATNEMELRRNQLSEWQPRGRGKSLRSSNGRSSSTSSRKEKDEPLRLSNPIFLQEQRAHSTKSMQDQSQIQTSNAQASARQSRATRVMLQQSSSGSIDEQVHNAGVRPTLSADTTTLPGTATASTETTDGTSASTNETVVVVNEAAKYLGNQRQQDQHKSSRASTTQSTSISTANTTQAASETVPQTSIPTSNQSTSVQTSMQPSSTTNPLLAAEAAIQQRRNEAVQQPELQVHSTDNKQDITISQSPSDSAHEQDDAWRENFHPTQIRR